MKSPLPVIAVLIAMLVGACGGGADSESEEDIQAAATTTVAETTTTVPAETTTTAEAPSIPTAPVVPGSDSDVDSIVDAYRVVFDSTTVFEDKEPYVTDLSGLEDTVLAYNDSGESLGGISLRADEVGIDGDTARVLYAFLFAESPAYTDLEGDAIRTDGGWQVTREFFCDIMASARVGCS